MNDLIRWEPFDELVSMRKDMNRIFNEFFSRPSTNGGRGIPLADMYQTDTEVVVKVTIPGVDPGDVDIQVRGDMLTIRGEVEEEREDKNATYHLREQRYRSFARSFSLPVMVNADKANAEIKNGILTLTLPKAEEALPKAIKVKAK